MLVTACGIQGYAPNDVEPRHPIYHVVKRGETLWSLGEQYKVDHQRLMLLNGINRPETVYVGQKILIGYLRAPANHPLGNATKKTAKLGTVSGIPGGGSKGLLMWPVTVGRLASGFGPRADTFHDGVDISAPEGTPVFAAHSGKVEYADDDLSGYGKVLIVRGDDQLYTIYAHNSRLLVAAGERIKRGQEISQVGNTGHSSGPHLHFEVRLKDTRGRVVAVDPLPLLQQNQRPRPRFRVNESLTPLLARLTN